MCGSAKEQLSASRLAKGLRHAGLPLDRVVVDQLIEAFSFRGVRGRRLSYTEFHRMVHCDALRSGGLETMDAEGRNGFAGGTRNLDEEVRFRKDLGLIYSAVHSKYKDAVSER